MTEPSCQYSLGLLESAWLDTRTPLVHSWQDILSELKDPIRSIDLSLDFVRHGETVLNAVNRVTGRQDVSLSARGVAQARSAALSLRSAYDMAWNSTLRRSKETLDLILSSGPLRVTARFEDARLDERSLGDLEGKPSVNIDAYARGDFRYAPPGGENFLIVTQRALSFLLDLASLSKTLGDALCALICTHVGPMRIFGGILEGQSEPAAVLKRSFSNTEIKSFQVHELVLPEFVRKIIHYQTCPKL